MSAFLAGSRKHLCVLALLLVASCKNQTATDCNDGVDNDADGMVDGDDPGCTWMGQDREAPDPPKPQCKDGIDNDGDELIDHPADPGCQDEADDEEKDPPPPPAECSDGIDNNGKFGTDYPYDPGCVDAMDKDEADEPATTACSDGKDNDDDGFIDFQGDPGCGSAADDEEYNPIVGECGPAVDVQPFPGSGVAEGDRAASDMRPNELVSPDCQGRGAEFVWRYDVVAGGALVVQTNHPETTLDTVVYVRKVCRSPETELGCVDDDPVSPEDPDGSSAGTLVIPRIDPGTYFIIVDTFSPGSLGHFKLTVHMRVGQGEVCNAVSSACAPGLVCRKVTPEAAEPTCEAHECGDGLDNDSDGTIDYPAEAGCTSASDDSEAIPADEAVPECGDEMDNDGDGKTDYSGGDPGCADAADGVELDECAPDVDVLPLDPAGTSGSTVGGSNLFSASCDSDSSFSPERVHAFRVLRKLTKVTFHLDAEFSAILYVHKTTCSDGPEAGCDPNDDGLSGVRDVTLAAPPVGEIYFVFVDGDWTGSGNYVLSAVGEVEAGETCDPADTHFVCGGGSVCRSATNKCEASQCNDGLDNDEDGKNDYPDEPGCKSKEDDDEVDPIPAPKCGNGLDDDDDSKIDFAGGDPGCESASDGNELDACIAGVEVIDLTDDGASGVTSGSSHFAGGCSGFSGSSPDVVYGFTLDRNFESLKFSTAGTSFDSVLYVRKEECGKASAEVGCSNVGLDGVGETVEIATPTKGDYFVFVDGVFSSGAYKLSVSGTLPIGEFCDPDSTQFMCTAGAMCDADLRVCTATHCNDHLDNDGDGKVDSDDPGCTSVLDTDESDPVSAPACGNGMDDDGDGKTDFPDDPGCGRASDDLETDCNDTDPLIDVSHSPSYSGTTVGKSNNQSPICNPTSHAPDVVHSFTIPGTVKDLQFDTSDTGSTPADTVLSVIRGGCDEVPLACNDDEVKNTVLTSKIVLPEASAGTYFVVVDGWSGLSGAYKLHASGTVKLGESCDPLQVQPGFLSCEGATTCQDLSDGKGNRCQ